jgi:hypothetical protein
MFQQILTLEQLSDAVEHHRAIMLRPHECRSPMQPKHRPAAFIINMNGSVLLHWFREGMYIKLRKNERVTPIGEIVFA